MKSKRWVELNPDSQDMCVDERRFPGVATRYTRYSSRNNAEYDSAAQTDPSVRVRRMLRNVFMLRK